MKKIDATNYKITTNKNFGVNAEWTMASYHNIIRTKHDNKSYDVASDIEIGDLLISVKANGFTLMAGSKCKGCKTFEGIWKRYYKNVHSNTWYYVTQDWQCYIMNKKEFSQFVHKFATLDRESSKNGGGLKIKAKRENADMIAWLEARAC